ncbi:ribosomal RNA small subunit methyltransferase E [Bacteroidia bacterium]|nr:ribosomal RNA small subunit methyltransferase E [Bacteroidia bacterium]
MYFFYTPNIASKFYTLNEAESEHCLRVLRLAAGDTVHLTDGKGGLYAARIVNAHPRKCEVEVVETQQNYGQRNYFLHIAIAPTKNAERYEWFLEKATEIGIDRITPLLCEHSERKQVKHERSQKVITAAMKQSLAAYHPDLQALTKFADFVMQPFDGTKCIAHCYPTARIPLQTAARSASRVLVLIGAEGDFSPAEIALARQQGYIEVSLGNSRLRTETAGIVACNTIQLTMDNEQ